MKLNDLEVGKLFSFSFDNEREGGGFFLKLYFPDMMTGSFTPVYDLVHHEVISMLRNVVGVVPRLDYRIVITMDQGDPEYGPKFKALKDLEYGTVFEYFENHYILVSTPGSRYQKKGMVCAIQLDEDGEDRFTLQHINEDFMAVTGEASLQPVEEEDGMHKLAKAMQAGFEEGLKDVKKDSNVMQVVDRWLDGSRKGSGELKDTERLKGCKDGEKVNHPAHYQSKNGIEVIDVIEAFTENLDGIQAFCAGNVLKYVCRWSEKNGLEDLEKAEWYLQKLKISLKAEKRGEFLKETT